MSDCISRKDVLDAINDIGSGAFASYSYYSNLFDFVCELPSVEPERKPGKWVKVINPDTNEWDGEYTCSECWRACVQMSMKYCANCGTDMREVQDGSCE